MLRRLRSTQPYAVDVALLILRITSGGLMMTHGWSKYLNFDNKSGTFPDPLHVGAPFSMGLTIFAELVCSGFLLIGLYTRFFLLPLIILMMVAVFFIHADDPLNVKEQAILFLIPYIALLMTGPGRYSLDGLLKK